MPEHDGMRVLPANWTSASDGAPKPDVAAVLVPVDSQYNDHSLELVHNEHWEHVSLRASQPQIACGDDGGDVELWLDSDGLDKLIAGAMAMKERLDKRAAKIKGESPEVQDGT